LSKDNSRRNNLDITAEIIEMAKKEPQLKTHIQYGVNLSAHLTKKYLGSMVSGGLLRIEGRGYVATKEGKQWHGYYSRLMQRTPEEIL